MKFVMIKMRIFLLLIFASILIACASAQIDSDSISQQKAAGSTSEVVLIFEVKWGALNPARGDNSPEAGNLWGDRNGSQPTGFLVRFADGFSSPPHIHNVTYRGVVINGNIHNDDPNADEKWMPGGSFWTQPAGEVHITAAKGSNNLAYIEIDSGPYLVHPAEKAFNNGEKPINVHQSNIVWIGQPGISAAANEPKVAFLWGNPQDNKPSGTLVKLSAGFTGKIISHSSTFRAVVIKGQLQYQIPDETDIKNLKTGSYFGSRGKTIHQVSCEAGEDCNIYVRTDGKFDVL